VWKTGRRSRRLMGVYRKRQVSESDDRCAHHLM
jgi:hypothetical protein